MLLPQVTKQIKSLNDRILQLEKITSNPTHDVIASRFKRPQAIVKGDVYIVTGPQQISGTLAPLGSPRTVVVALESSADTIGTGESWALCATSGLAWVNYVGGTAPQIGSYVRTADTSGDAGKVLFTSTEKWVTFGRVVRIDENKRQVLIMMNQHKSNFHQRERENHNGIHDADIDRNNPATNHNGSTLITIRDPLLRTIIFRPKRWLIDSPTSDNVVPYDVTGEVTTLHRRFVYLYFTVLSHPIGDSKVRLGEIGNPIPPPASLWNELTVTFNNFTFTDGYYTNNVQTSTFTGLEAPFLVRTGALNVGVGEIRFEYGHSLDVFQVDVGEEIVVASSEHENEAFRPYYEFSNDFKFQATNPPDPPNVYERDEE